MEHDENRTQQDPHTEELDEMAQTPTAAELIFRRPREDSDSYELHANNVRVAVVDPTFDCTGDRMVTLYSRNGEELETFRHAGYSVAITEAVATRLEELDALVSTLPGHELRDVTTDRARTVGTLRTVACACTATSYSADGLARAVELHDSEAVGRDRRRARHAAQDIRRAAELSARYSSTVHGELFPVETVVDATGEVLRLELSSLDDSTGTAEYVPHSGGTSPVRLSLVDALELDALVWTVEAAQGRAQLAADALPVEEILPPSSSVDALEELDALVSRTVELHGTSRLWDVDGCGCVGPLVCVAHAPSGGQEDHENSNR